MGSAVVGMHYVGMAAASFTPHPPGQWPQSRISGVEPYLLGGKIGLFGGAGVGKTVTMLEEARSSYATTFWVYLAICQSWMGDMKAASAAMASSGPAARRFGQRGLYRSWTRGVRAMWCYLVGRWDEA